MTLEETIAAHALWADDYYGHELHLCRCDPNLNYHDEADWAAHVAAEIRKVFGVVELPGTHLWDTGVQDDALNFEIGLQRHLRGIYFRVATYRNDGQEDDFCCEDSITPTEARNLAAALLAAANAAEVKL